MSAEGGCNSHRGDHKLELTLLLISFKWETIYDLQGFCCRRCWKLDFCSASLVRVPTWEIPSHVGRYLGTCGRFRQISGYSELRSDVDYDVRLCGTRRIPAVHLSPQNLGYMMRTSGRITDSGVLSTWELLGQVCFLLLTVCPSGRRSSLPGSSKQTNFSPSSALV